MCKKNIVHYHHLQKAINVKELCHLHKTTSQVKLIDDYVPSKILGNSVMMISLSPPKEPQLALRNISDGYSQLTNIIITQQQQCI